MMSTKEHMPSKMKVRERNGAVGEAEERRDGGQGRTDALCE